MNIRKITINDAQMYLNLLTQLDSQTQFMMYEEGERSKVVEDTKNEIKRVLELGSLMLVLEHNKLLVGYLTAERGFANRIKHSAYITVGILADYQGQGLGKKLFTQLKNWAITNNITRLELTVMKHNTAGVSLYKKMGFVIEGIKQKSLIVNGQYVDEYYMALVR